MTYTTFATLLWFTLSILGLVFDYDHGMWGSLIIANIYMAVSVK